MVKSRIRLIDKTAAKPSRDEVLALLRARRASYGDRMFGDSGELVRKMRDEPTRVLDTPMRNG
jgi:hypothetical protein